LAIAYKLCQMMKGNIIVASEPGEGTTFTVTLPVKEVPVSNELMEI
jgi:signal transduction histidine kinase